MRSYKNKDMRKTKGILRLFLLSWGIFLGLNSYSYHAPEVSQDSIQQIYACDEMERISSASGTHTYTYFQSQLLEERLNGSLEREHIYGLGMDDVIKTDIAGSQSIYYVKDRLGSVVAQISVIGPQEADGVIYPGGKIQYQILEYAPQNPFVKFVGEETPLK